MVAGKLMTVIFGFLIAVVSIRQHIASTSPRKEAVPARSGADRHALDHKPPGYPRLLASARREPIEPAQWPPSPTIRGNAGFSLDARGDRDRITQSSQRLRS